MIMSDPSVYRRWSDEELLQAAGAERQEYRQEPLALIDEELKRRGLSGDNRAYLEQKMASEREEGVQKLTGVRGWLLVFTLIVLGNSVCLLIGGFTQAYGSGASALGVLPALMIGGYGCYVSALLVQRDHSAPKHASRWLLIDWVATLAYAGLVYLMSGEVTLLLFYGSATLVWLEYLRKSRRVAATYGSTSSSVEPSPAPAGTK